MRVEPARLSAHLHLLRHRRDALRPQPHSPSEILDQALHFRRKEPVNHAVFMGMGEPLMNLDAVLAACERLPDVGIAHSARRSIDRWAGSRASTEWPRRARRCASRCRLAALRSELMP